MSARDWIEVLLLVVLTLNLVALVAGVLVALKKASQAAVAAQASVEQMKTELGATTAEARQTLQKLSSLAETLQTATDAEVRQLLRTTHAAVAHTETVLKGLADATASVRRLAAGAEALTAPGAVASALERATTSPIGRTAMIAAGVLTLLRHVLPAKTRQASKS